MSTYQILYWHDIPVQVRAGSRRDRASVELSARFQEAVDNAAMVAHLTGTDAYLEGFRWAEAMEQLGSPVEVATAVAAELEAQYATIDWRATAASLQADSTPNKSD